MPNPIRIKCPSCDAIIVMLPEQLDQSKQIALKDKEIIRLRIALEHTHIVYEETLDWLKHEPEPIEPARVREFVEMRMKTKN